MCATLNHMVNYSPATLNATFSALSHPTRRAILARLSKGESSVLELARPFDISLPGMTKHLRVLERAGLIACQKTGRVRRCRLDAAPLKDAAEWLDYYQRFWEARLEALADFLDDNEDIPEVIDDEPDS